MTAQTFTVRQAVWRTEHAAIRVVRLAVFVNEQRVPEELEWDGLDAECVHALAIDQYAQAIGTGRLLDTGQIGRMAVLRAWRGAGVGSAILKFLIAAAWARGQAECFLHAQLHAMSFYARHGFTAQGAEFMDANIPHRHMLLKLPVAKP